MYGFANIFFTFYWLKASSLHAFGFVTWSHDCGEVVFPRDCELCWYGVHQICAVILRSSSIAAVVGTRHDGGLAVRNLSEWQILPVATKLARQSQHLLRAPCFAFISHPSCTLLLQLFCRFCSFYAFTGCFDSYSRKLLLIKLCRRGDVCDNMSKF